MQATIKAKPTSEMTEAEKADARIAVARDVLARLRSNEFVAAKGTILSIRPRKGWKRSGRLRQLLDRGVESCHACARGALLMSKCRLVRDAKVFDILRMTWDEDLTAGGVPVDDELLQIFDGRQITLIEQAFELGHVAPKFGVPDSECRDAVAFGRGYPENRPRLAAILQNLIDHDSLFTP
jgi:hypothetical protein